jgi:hypothetical protein
LPFNKFDRRPFVDAALLGQLIEQFLGVLQIECLEALGKPAVDRGEQVLCLGAPALLGP